MGKVIFNLISLDQAKVMGSGSIMDELDGRGQMTDEANITLKCITTRPKKADTTNHLFAKVK